MAAISHNTRRWSDNRRRASTALQVNTKWQKSRRLLSKSFRCRVRGQRLKVNALHPFPHLLSWALQPDASLDLPRGLGEDLNEAQPNTWQEVGPPTPGRGLCTLCDITKRLCVTVVSQLFYFFRLKMFILSLLIYLFSFVHTNKAGHIFTYLFV